MILISNLYQLMTKKIEIMSKRLVLLGKAISWGLFWYAWYMCYVSSLNDEDDVMRLLANVVVSVVLCVISLLMGAAYILISKDEVRFDDGYESLYAKMERKLRLGRLEVEKTQN